VFFATPAKLVVVVVALVGLVRGTLPALSPIQERGFVGIVGSAKNALYVNANNGVKRYLSKLPRFNFDNSTPSPDQLGWRLSFVDINQQKSPTALSTIV